METSIETSYKNSVSLRQRNLNQFNVSVLRIPMAKQCFIKTRKLEAIQCFCTQDTNGLNSVSLRQGNLKQFNVSVPRIPMDKTVFH